jgi:hypothetical protein
MGNKVKREKAIALLKQISESKRFSFNWISLVNGKSGCEIHIKPEYGSDPSVLKPIFEKRDLQMKEAKGILVIYREHDESQ